MAYPVILISMFLLGFLIRAWIGTSSTSGRIAFGLESRIDHSAQKVLSTYLLVRIGLMGGAQISTESSAVLAVPLTLAICLSVLMMISTLLILRQYDSLDRETRISLAAHYGSVSIGTFAVVLVFLQSLGISYAPYVMAWVALMEFPAILLAVLLLGQGVRGVFMLLREDKMLFTLPISFGIGILFGKQVLSGALATLVFQSVFEPVLSIFLFQMGCKAGTHLNSLRQHQWLLIVLGILLPLLGGTLGAASGRLMGLGLGETTILATLTASASYVAAPTSMSVAILALRGNSRAAERAVSVSLAASLGLTLPFNILVGIHLYLSFSEWYQNRSLALLALAIIGFVLFCLLLWRKRSGPSDPTGRRKTDVRWNRGEVGLPLFHQPRRNPIPLQLDRRSRQPNWQGFLDVHVDWRGHPWRLHPVLIFPLEFIDSEPPIV